MPHAFTEDQLVEQPAIGLFTVQSALPNPQPGLSATLPPRWEKGRGLSVRRLVVRVSRLRTALERLNPALPPDAITAA